MSNVLIISGSPTPGSRLNGIIDYSQNKLEESGFEVDHLVVSELPSEDLIKANFASEAIKEAQAKVEKATAAIIASPVYKASYTGVLKTFLDLIPQKGLQGKIVYPLFVGGTIAHFLAIDYSLKPVVSALGATNILNGVYALDQWITRVDANQFELTEELTNRLETSLDVLIHEIKSKPRGVDQTASEQPLK